MAGEREAVSERRVREVVAIVDWRRQRERSARIGHGRPGRGRSGQCHTARQRPDAPLSEPEQCLLNPRIVIQSSGRPAMILGWHPYGKSRLSVAVISWLLVKVACQTVNLDR